jgi:hypothetical protein
VLVGLVAVAASATIGSLTTATGAPLPAGPLPGQATGTPPPRQAPGPGVAWEPAGRSVLGGPVLYLGRVGPAQVAWMSPELVRVVVVPGSRDPGGPWPWGGMVDPGTQPFLIAGFNGGFQWQDFVGGVLAFGRGFRELVPGQAALVAFADGSFTVGEWGRDVQPGPNVVAVRQNLGLLVDGGAPVPAAANPGAWGGSVAGVATMRSAVGVDRNGGLVWAGGRLSPLDLAGSLIAAGAVRGMQLDINPDWVHFDLYQPLPTGGVTGVPVFGATSADRFLRPDSRDFVVVVIRGTVLPGATKVIGAPPLSTAIRVR